MNSHIFDLLESTSLPGIALLIKSKQFIVKIIWLLFIVILAGLSIKYVIESIQTYHNYEVVTNIRVISEQSLPFPAISFCMIFNRSPSPSVNDMLNVIQYCSFDYNECSSGDFEIFHFPSPFNETCFRFNSGKNASNQSTLIRNSIKKGIDSGLKVLFNTSLLESLNEFDSKIGSYVNNASLLFLPIRPYYYHQDNHNMLIKGGNLIKIEKEFIQKLSEPYNHCVKKKINGFISDLFQYFIQNNITYLQSDCIDLCIWEKMKQKCNCTYGVGQYSECFRTSFDCIINISSKYRLKKLDIPLECKNECPQECEFNNYKTYQSYVGPFKSSDILNANQIGVNFYYEKLEYILIDQIAKMNQFDLVSSVGGTLGLFLGFSFFTLVEIIEILFELMASYLDKKLRNVSFISVQNQKVSDQIKKPEEIIEIS
jgi:hypothetical protein